MEIIIKLDHDEPVKVKTSSIYGETSPIVERGLQILREELHKTKEKYLQAEMDLQNRDDEIQDLKLENDRLKQREEIMLHFIKSCACMYSCKECDITDKQNHCHYLNVSDSGPIGTRMRNTAIELLSRLEAL